jgi:hypothetical protein
MVLTGGYFQALMAESDVGKNSGPSPVPIVGFFTMSGITYHHPFILLFRQKKTPFLTSLLILPHSICRACKKNNMSVNRWVCSQITADTTTNLSL